MTALHLRTAALLLAGAIVSGGVSAPLPAAEPTVVRIVAEKFSYTPAEVRLKKGSSVVLELLSKDRVHGFNLPELGIRTDVTPGTPKRVTITPGKTGTFPFHCDVFCGDGHDEMSGVVVVTE